MLRAGGFLDTLDEGVTGLYVEELSTNAVVATVRAARERTFDRGAVLRHAETYSRQRFIGRLREVVHEAAATGRA